MQAKSDGLGATVAGKQRGRSNVFAGLTGLAALCCAAAALLGCGRATDDPVCASDEDCRPAPQHCQQGLATYADGASRPAGDGCNTCVCTDGEWSCTAIGCVGSACVYGGQIRADGSSFPADDGCNQCSCHDGAVACTERACVPSTCSYDGQLLLRGVSVPAGDGCNSCSCIDGRLACTLIDCLDRCTSNSDCGDSQYCAFPTGACPYLELTDGAADAETEPKAQPAPFEELPLPTGECRDRPTLCTEEPAPVCGCDGQTYRSACAAASLGLSLAGDGACAQGN